VSSTTIFLIEDACNKKVTELRIYNGQAEVITLIFTVDLVCVITYENLLKRFGNTKLHRRLKFEQHEPY
jgi:hypothetical protein